MNPLALLGALSPRAWKAIGVIALIGLLLFAVLRWGQSRYDAGEAASDARWKAAAERLAAQAREAGLGADRVAAERIEDHASRVADEKEKIDEAIASGASPLDVLFGG